MRTVVHNEKAKCIYEKPNLCGFVWDVVLECFLCMIAQEFTWEGRKHTSFHTDEKDTFHVLHFLET